jgi:hypothetical protein
MIDSPFLKETIEGIGIATGHTIGLGIITLNQFNIDLSTYDEAVSKRIRVLKGEMGVSFQQWRDSKHCRRYRRAWNPADNYLLTNRTVLIEKLVLHCHPRYPQLYK